MVAEGMTRSMSWTRCTIAALFLAPAVLVVSGCDSGDKRSAVSGTVSIDGNPLPEGQIVFEPQGSGRMGVGLIADGRYSIPEDRGAFPGNYIVRITAERPSGKMVAPGAYDADQTPVELTEQYLSPKYNTASELRAEVQPGTVATYDFDLVSER